MPRTYNIYPRGGTGPLAVKSKIALLRNSRNNVAVFRANRVAQPVISPVGGSYAGLVVVTITTTTPGAQIYYTTNNTPADFNSTPYFSSFSLSTTSIVHAIAYLDGLVTSMPTNTTFVIT